MNLLLSYEWREILNGFVSDDRMADETEAISFLDGVTVMTPLWCSTKSRKLAKGWTVEVKDDLVLTNSAAFKELAMAMSQSAKTLGQEIAAIIKKFEKEFASIAKDIKIDPVMGRPGLLPYKPLPFLTEGVMDKMRYVRDAYLPHYRKP